MSKNKREGLSADCKLPPEIALAILMKGKEHPCDRCNVDRRLCRGFLPLGDLRRPLYSLTIHIERAPYPAESFLYTFVTDLNINGQHYGLRENFNEDAFQGMFDVLWKSWGKRLKQFFQSEE